MTVAQRLAHMVIVALIDSGGWLTDDEILPLLPDTVTASGPGGEIAREVNAGLLASALDLLINWGEVVAIAGHRHDVRAKDLRGDHDARVWAGGVRNRAAAAVCQCSAPDRFPGNSAALYRVTVYVLAPGRPGRGMSMDERRECLRDSLDEGQEQADRFVDRFKAAAEAWRG